MTGIVETSQSTLFSTTDLLCDLRQDNPSLEISEKERQTVRSEFCTSVWMLMVNLLCSQGSFQPQIYKSNPLHTHFHSTQVFIIIFVCSNDQKILFTYCWCSILHADLCEAFRTHILAQPFHQLQYNWHFLQMTYS